MNRVETYDDTVEVLSGNPRKTKLSPLSNFTVGKRYQIFDEKPSGRKAGKYDFLSDTNCQYQVTDDTGEKCWIPSRYFKPLEPKLLWNFDTSFDESIMVDIRRDYQKYGRPDFNQIKESIEICNKNVDSSYKEPRSKGPFADLDDSLYENYLAGTLTKNEVNIAGEKLKTPLDKQLGRLRKQCFSMAKEIDGIIMMLQVLSDHRIR